LIKKKKKQENKMYITKKSGLKFLVFFLIVCFSCSSQEVKIDDIQGNWYNYKNLVSGETDYVETYFNKTYFQAVSFNGYSMAYKYIIDNNILYTLPSDGTTREYYAHVSLNKSKDVFELKGQDDHVILKRIEGIFTFENYSKKEISKTDFWDAFLNRKSIWEEAKNKPD